MSSYCSINLLEDKKPFIKLDVNDLDKTAMLPQIARLVNADIVVNGVSECVKITGLGGYSIYVNRASEDSLCSNVLSINGFKECLWKPYYSFNGLVDYLLKEGLIVEDKDSIVVINSLPIEAIYLDKNSFNKLYPLEVRDYVSRESVSKEFCIPGRFDSSRASISIDYEYVRVCIGSECISIKNDGINKAFIRDNHVLEIHSRDKYLLIDTLYPLIYIDASDEVLLETICLNPVVYLLNPYSIYTIHTNPGFRENYNTLWIGLWCGLFIGIVNPLFKEIMCGSKKVVLEKGVYLIYLSLQRRLHILHNIAIASTTKPVYLEGYRARYQGFKLYSYTPATVYTGDIVYGDNGFYTVFFNPDNMFKKIVVTASTEIKEAIVYSFSSPEGTRVDRVKPNIVEIPIRPYEVVIVKLLIGKPSIGYQLIRDIWSRRVGVYRKWM